MRLSELFLPTLRDDPSEAEVASHRLLLRAGYIRQVMAGVYSMLPMGLRTMHRIEEIVREEMPGVTISPRYDIYPQVRDKAALLALVKHKQLPWPQFFEDKAENRFAKEYDISSIPAMWLVNKQGKLVDMNAREGLEKKVEKLLAEK